MKAKPIRNQRGMTILEILWSFALLAIFALTSLKLITDSQALTQDTQMKLLAVGAARSVMEVVKTTPLEDLDDSPSPVSVSSYIPTDLPGGAIAISTSPSSLSGVDIATVTVRVSWTGSKGRSRTFDLSTLKSKYDSV